MKKTSTSSLPRPPSSLPRERDPSRIDPDPDFDFDPGSPPGPDDPGDANDTLFRGWAILLVVFLLSLPLGCGTSTTLGMGTSPLEEIRALEDDIERQLEISYGRGGCHDRCRAAESICDSAIRICEVARDLPEPSALESCRRAEDTCHEARRRVRESCSCP